MEHGSQPAGHPAVLCSPVPTWGHHRRKAGLKFAFLGKTNLQTKERKKPTTQRDHINSSREPLTQRQEQQSDPSHILDAIRYAMETMWIIFFMNCPPPLVSSPLPHFLIHPRSICSDRKEAVLPLPHDSPNQDVSQLAKRNMGILNHSKCLIASQPRKLNPELLQILNRCMLCHLDKSHKIN